MSKQGHASTVVGKAEGPATGTWLNQLAHPLCGAITKELGEMDRRKGGVSLFILCSVRFKFLTMRSHLYVYYIII